MVSKNCSKVIRDHRGSKRLVPFRWIKCSVDSSLQIFLSDIDNLGTIAIQGGHGERSFMIDIQGQAITEVSKSRYMKSASLATYTLDLRMVNARKVPFGISHRQLPKQWD